MKKIFFCLTITLFFTITVFSQSGKYIWPIKDVRTGEGIIYKPQDNIKNEKNFATLFIKAKEGTVVIAPQDGTIGFLCYFSMISLQYSESDQNVFKSGGNIGKQDVKTRGEIAKKVSETYIKPPLN